MTDRMPNMAGVSPCGDRRCVNILLIEDSVADARLVRTLLRDIQPKCELHVVGDGPEALDFLYQRDRFKGAPTPGIIVLDWSLPRQNGDQVLGAIKSDPDLRPIPVIVLSSSAADEHVLRGYELQASCWVVKGSDLDEARHRIRTLIEFWTSTAQLPRRMPPQREPAVS